MATHSSTLAWKIPGTEKPCRLQSVHGLTKSRTRLSDSTHFISLTNVHLGCQALSASLLLNYYPIQQPLLPKKLNLM